MERLWVLVLLQAVLLLAAQVRSPPAVSLRTILREEMASNTVHFLRERLLACLLDADLGRQKRMLQEPWARHMETQMDIDILVNTQEYLIERLLSCRAQQSRAATKQSLGLPLAGHKDAGEAVPGRSRYFTTGNSAKPLRDIVDVPAEGQSSRIINSKQLFEQKAKPMVDAPVIAHGRPAGGVKTEEVTSFQNGGVEFITQSSAVVTLATGLSADGHATVFHVRGKEVTCEEVELLNANETMRCRNLWVDDVNRLPNSDYCPLKYNPEEWRHLADIQSRTFKVLHLTSLCAAIGTAVNSTGYITDVGVTWDCDMMQDRLLWLDGRWAGTVRDNGFLRDLECSFNQPISV